MHKVFLEPTIFVVVLNYNGKATLANCLSSIYQSDYPNFEVLIVDNASTDGSLEEAKRLFLKASFVKNSANLGFSRGNNIGIRYALEKFADYVFILGSDTLIEKTTLSSLAQAASKNPQSGILGPIILTADNKYVWFAGGLIDWFNLKINPSYKIISSQPYATEYLSGCALFVKKEVFQKIGLFDERFFLYYADADFSVRTKRADFNLLVVPTAKIQRLEQNSDASSVKIYWLVLSRLLFFHLNVSGWQKIWLNLSIALGKLKNFYNLAFTKNETARSVHRAYKDYKNLRLSFPQRRESSYHQSH